MYADNEGLDQAARDAQANLDLHCANRLVNSTFCQEF